LPDAELFATGTIAVRSDDNIFLAPKATSDTIWEITPGVAIEFGKNADLKGNLTLVDSFLSYSDHSALNTNLFSADFAANFSDGKTKLSFSAGYHELNQNTVDSRPINPATNPIGGFLVRRDQFQVGLNGEADVSTLTSIAAGASFDHMNYKRAGYADSDGLRVPLSLYYKWTPKTDVSVGYTYSNYQPTIGLDSTDHFFNVGLRGELLPLLSGEVKAGVDRRNLSGTGAGTTLGANSRTDIGIDGRATYSFSPKTKISLSLANSHATSPAGVQEKDFNLGGQVSFAIDANWGANLGMTWRNTAYSRFGRIGPHEDDYFEATAGAQYTISSSIRINANYTYRNNSVSNADGLPFSGNLFSLSAVLRY